MDAFIVSILPCKCVNSLFVFFVVFITLFILCNFFFFSVCVLLAVKKKKCTPDRVVCSDIGIVTDTLKASFFFHPCDQS